MGSPAYRGDSAPYGEEASGASAPAPIEPDRGERVQQPLAASGHRAGVPTLLFVTGERLLAETLAVLFTSNGSWAVEVLAEDHADLLDACQAIDPAVVVLDIDTHVLPGFDLLATMRNGLPRAGIVVLSESADLMPEAIARGAGAFLTYAASLEEVREAVESVRGGRTMVAAADLAELLEGLHSHPTRDIAIHLSPREFDILHRLASGESTADMAAGLGISEHTVRKHIQNLLAKLGVHSRLQAAAYAARMGLG